jgi:hypothetical protein
MTNPQAPNHKQSPNSKVQTIAAGLPDASRNIDMPPAFWSFEPGPWDLFGH